MQIDSASARALQAIVEYDIAAVRRLAARLEAVDPRQWSRQEQESAAYQLHNTYNALENSFLQVSRTFENHITQPERWHRELLEKMFLDLEPLRPALLPAASRPLLRDLLAFRHLFRHAYESELDAGKLERLLTAWRGGWPAVLAALESFAKMLAQTATRPR